MNKIFSFILITAYSVSQLIGADFTYRLPLRIKRVGNSEIKLRIIPQNYLEFKSIGLSQIDFEITPFLAVKEGKSIIGNSRKLNFKPSEKVTWESFKTDSNVVICAQLLYGKNAGTGETFDQQIKSTLEMQENLFVLATMGSSFSWDAAQLSNVGFTLPLHSDTFYTVKMSIGASTYFKNGLTTEFIISNNLDANDKPLLAAEGIEHGVTLSWPPSPSLIAYDIFTKKSNSSEFIKLNSLPYNEIKNDSTEGISIIRFNVSLEENYQPQEYKIRGYDLFGGISEFSEVQISYGRDLTPPDNVDSFTYTSSGENHVQLNWDLHEDSDRSGIRILYANNYDGPYKTLKELDKNARTFTHNQSNNILSNFYRIVMFDTANNQNGTTPIMVVTKDTVPPEAATELNYKISQTGKIDINWNPSKSADLQGYRIATATSPEGPWVFLNSSSVIGNQFSDSVDLKHIRGNRFYAIKSVDFKGNFGVLSEVVKVELPDKIAPAGVIASVKPDKMGNLKISFNIPKEKDLSHIEYRRIKLGNSDTSDWNKIENWQSASWIDEDVIHGNKYVYMLRAVDRSSNTSNTFTTEPKGPLSAPINISGITLSTLLDEGEVQLRWNKTPENIDHVRIYRKAGNNEYYTIGTVNDGKLIFTDKDISKYMSYSWAIRFKSKEGGISDYIYSEAMYIK